MMIKREKFYPLQNQRGIGLIEVLVALMLLAIAVLGFSAMQMTAVKATDESLLRTRAITVMRGGAEMMRANPKGIKSFKDAINSTIDPSAGTISVDNASISYSSCMNNAEPKICTVNQMATKDAIAVKKHARDNDMKIAMITCPGTAGVQETQCFVTSWGKTEPEFDTTDTACADANGVYNRGAQCFIMEAY